MPEGPNLYGYVGNNPANFYDYYGLFLGTGLTFGEFGSAVLEGIVETPSYWRNKAKCAKQNYPRSTSIVEGSIYTATGAGMIAFGVPSAAASGGGIPLIVGGVGAVGWGSALIADGLFSDGNNAPSMLGESPLGKITDHAYGDDNEHCQ